MVFNRRMSHGRFTPRFRVLPLLWVAWWMVAYGLLLTSLLYGHWDSPQEMKNMRWMLTPALWYISGSSAVVLGSLHFGIWKSGLWRRRAVKLTAILLAILIGASLVLLAVKVRNAQSRTRAQPESSWKTGSGLEASALPRIRRFGKRPPRSRVGRRTKGRSRTGRHEWRSHSLAEPDGEKLIPRF